RRSEASSICRFHSAISERMKRRCTLFFALVFSVATQQALAAIREPRPDEKAIRVLADAKAEQPLAAARELQAAPASAPAPEVLRDESLRRELLEHSNHLNARFDQVDAKIYEVAGQHGETSETEARVRRHRAQPDRFRELGYLREASGGLGMLLLAEIRQHLAERLAGQHVPQPAAGTLVGQSGGALRQCDLADAEQHVDDHAHVERQVARHRQAVFEGLQVTLGHHRLAELA